MCLLSAGVRYGDLLFLESIAYVEDDLYWDHVMPYRLA